MEHPLGLITHEYLLLTEQHIHICKLCNIPTFCDGLDCSRCKLPFVCSNCGAVMFNQMVIFENTKR